MKKQIPSSLTALVHHVELSKAGWQERSLEYLILAILRESDTTLRCESILLMINDRLPAPLGRAQLEQLLINLIKKERILKSSDGSIILSEKTIQEFAECERNQSELIARVQDRFQVVENNLPAEARITWEQLEDNLIIPLVSELGARTYELLSGTPREIAQTQTFLRVLDIVPENQKGLLADTLQKFFNPKDADIRAYILRYLSAALLVQAVALPPETLAVLEKRASSQLKLNIVLDTNFLFSLVGLHENPADDVVIALEQLITKLKERIKINLYVLPITFDEIKRTVIGYENSLSGFVLTRRIAQAVYRV